MPPLPLPPSHSRANTKILALATANPPLSHPQEEYLQAFLRQHKLTPQDDDFVRRVFKASKIKTCYSFLPTDRLFSRMTREEYLSFSRGALLELALDAGRSALSQFQGPPSDVTHLIFCTFTGAISSPSLDCALAQGLGLSPLVNRLNVENTGCHGGFRCLATARDLVLAQPHHVALVIVCDVLSASGNQLPHHKDLSPIDRSSVIGASLFRDAGGAAIVAHPHYQPKQSQSQGAGIPPAPSMLPPLPPTSAPLPLNVEIVSTRVHLVPDSSTLAVMRERNDGVIHHYLDKQLPHAVHEALPSVVTALLANSPYPDLQLSDCCYAVHAGGPKIIEEVSSCLGVSETLLASAWHIMQHYGNVSGSSNLVVLEHVVREKKFQCGKKFCIGLSFGPGITIQAILMRLC